MLNSLELVLLVVVAGVLILLIKVVVEVSLLGLGLFGSLGGGLILMGLARCLLAGNGGASGLLVEGLSLIERVGDDDVVKDGSSLDLC